MVEEVCFLKSWTLTKTAISKCVFNPYRQDLQSLLKKPAHENKLHL